MLIHERKIKARWETIFHFENWKTVKKIRSFSIVCRENRVPFTADTRVVGQFFPENDLAKII